MVDAEVLTKRARRAYELGRLRMAMLSAVIIVPIAALCFFQSGAREECACLGLLLLGGSIALRYRDARGVEAVTTGLLAGIVPLALGVAMSIFEPTCSGDSLWLCFAACVVSGLVAGAVLGVRAARRKMSLSTWLIAGAIALIAASMGCVGVGPAMAGVAVGLVAAGSVGAGLLVMSRR